MGEYRVIQEGIYLLLVAFVVNIFVTMKSMKDSSKVGPILLASNLAADFHLIIAIFACGIISVDAIILNDTGLIISLIVGASIANLVFLITNISNLFISDV
jgi:hypothetical protein